MRSEMGNGPTIEQRALVVGLGNVAKAWLPYLSTDPLVDLVGVVDPRTDVAARGLERFGLEIKVEAELAEALNSLHPDVVINLTPPAAHAEVVRAALDFGCHVFTEKPLTISMTDAVTLASLAEEKSLVLAVMQNRRFVPQIRRLREEISGDAIGTLTVLSSDMWMSPKHDNTYLAGLAHPLLFDMSLHTFDQARFLSGSDAARVSAYEYNPVNSWYQGNAAAICTFEMDSGAVFTYRGNWVAPGFTTSYDSQWRLVGTDGTAVWDSWGPAFVQTALDVVPGDVERAHGRQLVGASGLPGHEACAAEMFSALREGRQPETSARDNLNTLAMVFAAQMSAQQRRWVEIEEVLGPLGGVNR
jgi:predicted dehydrogenase